MGQIHLVQEAIPFIKEKDAAVPGVLAHVVVVQQTADAADAADAADTADILFERAENRASRGV